MARAGKWYVSQLAITGAMKGVSLSQEEQAKLLAASEFPTFTTRNLEKRWEIIGSTMSSYFQSSSAPDNWFKPRLKEWVKMSKSPNV